MLLYAITIFLSAFLLFQIQPLIAKIILPWFGGSAAVWSSALVFFQIVLLAGYAYAHALIRFLREKSQWTVHAALLVIACVAFPILPSRVWEPSAVGDPTLRILALLAATIGLPYFLLASTSPLLQAWYVRRFRNAVPYRLFALSNFGSMLALVSFPFWVEPQLTSHQQAYTWRALFFLFAILCGYVAWRSSLVKEAPAKNEDVGVSERSSIDKSEVNDARPGAKTMLLWVALASCASTLLVSVTTHLSQNVAPIPLLWVLPLALYLLTFILAFESDRIYQRWIFLPLLVPALGSMAYMIWAVSGNLDVNTLIPWLSAGLFVCCMVCHGELARRKPAPRYLTLFYLMVSLGGAIGGIFVAVIAPHVFNRYLELQIALVGCAILAIIVTWNAEIPRAGSWALRFIVIAAAIVLVRPKIAHVDFGGNIGALISAGAALALLGLATFPKTGKWPLRVAFVVGAGILAGYLARREQEETGGYRLTARNFYGVLRVKDDVIADMPTERILMHGTIKHGSEVLDDKLRYEPISYYGVESGVGRAMRALEERGPVRVGVIGLGAGVMCAWGRPGDVFRVYEINPLVEKIAQTEFGYYPHLGADKKILMGDARLTMERQEPQNFDLIAVDAFSSDAIPIHLLTMEAFAQYFRHLKPSGILAMHVSNRYLDLVPVCARAAQDFNKKATVVVNDDDTGFQTGSTWVLLTDDARWFRARSFEDADRSVAVARTSFRTWTDEYSNVVQIFKWKK